MQKGILAALLVWSYLLHNDCWIVLRFESLFFFILDLVLGFIIEGRREKGKVQEISNLWWL